MGKTFDGINAKQELLDAVEETGSKIKCAVIRYSRYWEEESFTVFLKLNYSEKDFNKFLNALDFHYDDGYGSQELFGTVWLEDGTWLSRAEYDGSEWWEHHALPDIPEECM